MGLKLNAIDDSRLAESLPHDERIMEEVASILSGLPDDANALERERRTQGVASTSLRVAMAYYQLEREPRLILDLLGRTASAYVSYLEMPQVRAQWQWQLVKFFSWAFTFGDASTRRRLSKLLPHQATQVSKHSLYLQVLISFVRGENVDQPLEQLIADTSDRSANKHLSTVVLPCALALRAAIRNDAETLNAALADLDKQHRREVRGELKTSREDGFMIVPALPYLRLAIERNIPITTQSIYLPTSLVELACRTTSST